MRRHLTTPGKFSLQQPFAGLQGEERQLELLRLADWPAKATADGSRIRIERPDGSIGRIAYGHQ